ncbi:MAG TPA: N,N-dimethylformamidase beta subunit family domain-containing protein [Solirubrobacterales bacterium]|nr:N,N-dimethylformamidase beta subunit family domain-containing protein [Solirubrobacterales bacterium]
MSAAEPPCPICGSGERHDALGRRGAACASCGALERHRAVARECAPLLARGGRCLEAGPANRRVYGEFLRERGWQYRSVDRWRTGNPHDPRAVDFVDQEADLNDLSIFADGEFDLFIAQHVIEEIENYERALDEIARVLRDGGAALLEIPFDPRRPRSEPQPPDHFGNVWIFGADLLDQLRARFGAVREQPLAEGEYRGTLLICTVGEGFSAPAGEPAATVASPSVTENALPGDDFWWAGRKASAHAIEAYASWPSAEPGGRLELHVSTDPAARYRVTIHRLGWYGGSGGRTITEHPCSGDAQGLARAAPTLEAGPAIPSCGWPVTDSIRVGRDWASGQYVAKLMLCDGEHEGKAAFVPFVVRAPLDRRADILVQMPFTTAHAYNHWGGKSLYPSNSSDEVPAVKVSFDRPFPSWHDANLNARWPFVWDIQLIRFLEREGYDVAYTTDLDTHREPWGLLGHPLVVTSGHDEYWSDEMRGAFEAVRDSGASVACMGANSAYWQARFEDAGRAMVEYRRHDADPEPDPARKTVLFRDLDPPRPECLLWGVQYQDGMTPPRQPPRHYELSESCLGDPWLEGTGFEHPATLEGLVGYEWDALQAGQEPPEATVFFHYENERSNADAVRHRAPAGGIVFAAGSLQFSWGLDDWARPGMADERLQRFMRNGLDEMIAVGRRATASN